ncbi:MAG: tetratricopeptide repeat protein [Bryobacteraceae bacterium]|nr:tetratricopeptide repeat protein [Bryobacteraceae bacterium]
MFIIALGLLLLQADSAADPAQLGLKAMEKEKYAEAVEHFRKAVAADEKDYASYFNLALAYTFLDKDPEAIAAYRKTLELKPGLYEASLNLGVVLLRADQPKEAVPHLVEAAKQKPNEFRPNYYAAEAYRETRQFAEAAPLYEKAAQLDPKSAATQLGLARTLVSLKRAEEALKAYERAIGLDAAYEEAIFEAAAMMEGLGKKQEAIALWKRYPDNPTARERMGVLQLETGDVDGAIVNLEEAVKRSPAAANRVALANAYLAKGQPDKAVPYVELALKEVPEDAAVRMTYGRLLRDQKKYDQAAVQFYAVTKQQPEFVPAWRELSVMLISLKQWENALASFDRLKQLGENPPAHDYFRALIYDQNHAYKQAQAAYQSFLARSENKYPEEEFKARQRLRVIEKELNRR